MNELLNVGHAPEMDVIERYQSWDGKSQQNPYYNRFFGKTLVIQMVRNDKKT